ncbi:MAG: hypothetical protein GY841_02725 [FCB group bacterium]|nr:hypothetical protein [FCB group bacterium]
MAKKNVTGLRGVLNAMKSAEKRHARNAQIGLRRAANELERDSKEIVPVDLGPLKASGKTVLEGRGFDREASVEYSAKYAVYVHENPNAAHGAEFNRQLKEGKKKTAQGKRKKPVKGKKKDEDSAGAVKAKGKVHKATRGVNQQYKYLEKPARENRKKYIAKVAEQMRKK